MHFSSLVFTFYFLPVVVALYYLAKEKYRNTILLVASLLFYSYGEPKFVYVMVTSIILNYLFAWLMSDLKHKERPVLAKIVFTITLALNIGILFVYKYLCVSINLFGRLFHININIAQIALPIGISFFTFQAMSYVIDVYRGTVEVQKNPLKLALYISFFPQLVAGPIVRYSTISEQIDSRECTVGKFGEGTRRFFLGFGKKIIIANNLAIVAEEVFNQNSTETNPLFLWIGAICFTLQIYYDFSGYSDMAIGLGKMFGFEFEENFNYPYFSKSITDFWRRWHISLGQWFRDYVYFPLGGARVSVPRHIINLLIVWAITGIWHGAGLNFLVWGLYYFVLLVVEKYLIKPEKRKSKLFAVAWRIFTLICVIFGWVLFNSSSLISALKYCYSMLGGNHIAFSVNAQMVRCLREYGAFMLMGVVFSTPIARVVHSVTENSRYSKVFGLAFPLVYGAILIWSVSFILLGAHNPFIYFNF